MDGLALQMCQVHGRGLILLSRQVAVKATRMTSNECVDFRLFNRHGAGSKQKVGAISHIILSFPRLDLSTACSLCSQAVFQGVVSIEILQDPVSQTCHHLLRGVHVVPRVWREAQRCRLTFWTLTTHGALAGDLYRSGASSVVTTTRASEPSRGACRWLILV